MVAPSALDFSPCQQRNAFVGVALWRALQVLEDAFTDLGIVCEYVCHTVGGLETRTSWHTSSTILHFRANLVDDGSSESGFVMMPYQPRTVRPYVENQHISALAFFVDFQWHDKIGVRFKSSSMSTTRLQSRFSAASLVL